MHPSIENRVLGSSVGRGAAIHRAYPALFQDPWRRRVKEEARGRTLCKSSFLSFGDDMTDGALDSVCADDRVYDFSLY